MDQTIRRRTFLGIYLTVMILASLFLLEQTFAPGEMVQIDDREAVMRRRTSSVITSLILRDPYWQDMEIIDHELLYSLSQRINSIPRVSGEFPGDAPGKLSGEVTFADGTHETFSLGTVLTIGDVTYYSPEAETALSEIHRTLAGQLYTLQNLGAFFQPGHRVTLSDGEISQELSPEAAGQLRQAIEAGTLVEDFEEILGGPTPRYTIQVHSQEGLAEVRLLVYGNESIQVYNTYSSGQPLALCFGAEVVPLCQGLLGAA